MFRLVSICAAGVLFSAVAAQAASVKPINYTMRNGDSGLYNYWDDSYNGSGDNESDGALLSGGVGDLTDGVIATDNWADVEGPSKGPFGPYVGWAGTNPVITFNFDQIYEFASATFYFDGDGTAGGVSAPRSVQIGSVIKSVPDLTIDEPFALTLDLAGLSASSLTATIVRQSVWVFLSEVKFTTTAPPMAPVPVPAGVLLLGTGLAGLSLLRRRR